MNRLVRWGIPLAIGAIIWFLPVPAGLKPPAWKLFAIFVATIAGFISQPMPIGAIALISVTFSVLLGVLKIGDALSGFGNSVIWLIVSAFLFAKAFVKTGLGRRVAFVLIKLLGDSPLKLGYTLALSDLIISPATPSNTARTGGIIFPIVKSLSSAFGSEPGPTSRKIGAFLSQTAYQANVITSGMFMTAMAANPFAAKMAEDVLGIKISWGLWALAASVPGIVSLTIIPYLLYKFYPPTITDTRQAQEIAKQELENMGPTSYGEKVVAGVFTGALILWATSQITKLDATAVALLAVVVMLVSGVLVWKDVLEEQGAWDTLIWMGALVGLAGFLAKLGFIPWFAKLVSSYMVGLPWIQVLAVLLIIYMYSHYGFASLAAHITAMYGAFIAVAAAAGAPPFLAALSLAFVANLCMSLTHYASGPSPIYFGAGYVSQNTWWTIGFCTSVVNLIIWVGVGAAWWKVLGLW